MGMPLPKGADEEIYLGVDDDEQRSK